MEMLGANDELKAMLDELEALLHTESAALKDLDRDALDAITDKKLTLFDCLRELRALTPPTQDDRQQLERVKKLALDNQLLLVHARDTVRGIISTVLGNPEPLPSSSHAAPVPAGGVRLNVRG